MYDPVRAAQEYDDEREKWLMSRPVCDECGEHIQDEYAYRFGDQLICEMCMRDHVEYFED